MTARATLARRIDAALGRGEVDLVIRNARALDIVRERVVEGDIAIVGDRIVGVGGEYRGAREIDANGRHVAPGLIDAHCHVESSLVTPTEFDRCVLPHGVTTAVWDPHEIANVLGTAGLDYALDGASRTVMDLRVALSSCVPATAMETSGARLEAADLLPYADHPKVVGLAELMNFPGVLTKDDGILAKLEAFGTGHVDGHAPLLRGTELDAYLASGVRTDHECTSADEALEKLGKGARVFIREGSVSKDLDALREIITPATAPFLAFCTDDRNPLDIAEEGHIDHMVRTAIRDGAPLWSVYRLASWSAAQAFGLRDRGLVAPGWRADLLVLDDLDSCRVGQVVAGGRVVNDELFSTVEPVSPDRGLGSVRMPSVPPEAFRGSPSDASGPVIGVEVGKIITQHQTLALPTIDGRRTADPSQDVAKVAVIERHGHTRNANGWPNIGVGFVQGFGLKRGALASSVGHDSHNVTVVGMDDGAMARAANRVRELSGGFVVADETGVLAEFALPLAGLMSLEPYEGVERALRPLRDAARALGCTLPEPFLQVGFLPLPVIPHLKITDRGMFDVDRFAFVC